MRPLKLAELQPVPQPGAFETLLARIDGVLAAIETWDEPQRRRVHELREAIEALHADAFRRLVRGLRDEPQADARLRELLGDEVIYAVMRRVGVLRPSLHERIEDALQSVRPQLVLGGGNVALLAVLPPEGVRLRWDGACRGDGALARSLRGKVRSALGAACPEITVLLSDPDDDGAAQ